jgi:enamine deaminase RidA (YjgF/YER057c/UK114 family)
VEDDDLPAVDEAIVAAFAELYPARTVAGVAWVSGGARLQVEALAARC